MDKVTHFEIPAKNKQKSAQFYESVFGWKMTDVPMEQYGSDGVYTTAVTTKSDSENMPTETGGINGAIIEPTEAVKSPVLTISVDSIEKHLEDVQMSGGKVVAGKEEIPNMGSYAYVEDPAGNVIGLWQDADKPA